MKKLKVGSLVAIGRPDALYVCKVISINTKPAGEGFDYVWIDDMESEQLPSARGKEK
jgi:hypothetical protein